jgi:hypothetical protein
MDVSEETVHCLKEFFISIMGEKDPNIFLVQSQPRDEIMLLFFNIL